MRNEALQRFYLDSMMMGSRWLKCARCGDVISWSLHGIPFGHEDDHVIALEVAHTLKGCNGALYEHSPLEELIAGRSREST